MANLKGAVLILLPLVVAEVPSHAQRGTPRIRPVESAEWTDVHREILGTRAKGGSILNAVKVYLRHPELFRSFGTFSRYIEGNASTLSPRAKEILVLRTVWLCRDEYSWAYHVPAAKRAGLTDDEIVRITRGPEAPGWNGFDAALVRAADQLHANQFIEEATWRTLAGRYNDHELMDLIFTVGHRTLASMFHKSAGVELEPGIAGFPK